MPNRLAIAVVAIVLLVLCRPALSQENLIHELRGGVLVHDVNMWGAGDVEDGAAVNGELAFRSFGAVLDGQVRPVIGASYVSGDRTSYAYADARWEYTQDWFFFGIGLGAAIHDGELRREPGRKDLGSRILFHVPIEAGVQITDANRVSIYFEHVSNAWLADPNPGMDNIGLRLAHRF